MATSIKRFSKFFRNYGLSLGLIVASLPIGLQWTRFIDYYSFNGNFLTFLASLVAYLTVAAIFGARNSIGRNVFPQEDVLDSNQDVARIFLGHIVPIAAGAGAVLSLMIYTAILSSSVQDIALDYSYTTAAGMPSVRETLEKTPRAPGSTGDARVEGQLFSTPGPEFRIVGQIRYSVNQNGFPIENYDVLSISQPAFASVLQQAPPSALGGYSFFLTLFYVFAFAGASLSLVWFGILEYLQEQLGLDDATLMKKRILVEYPDPVPQNRPVRTTASPTPAPSPTPQPTVKPAAKKPAARKRAVKSPTDS